MKAVTSVDQNDAVTAQAEPARQAEPVRQAHGGTNAPATCRSVPETSRSIGVIAFCLGDEIFAVDMTSVLEIIKISSITPLYRVDDFFLGLVNLRGQIKPVIDLAIFLGLPCSPGTSASARPAIVITDGESGLVCLVDRIEKVRWLSADDMREVSPATCRSVPATCRSVGAGSGELKCYVKSTARTGKKPVSVLDIEQIMKSSVWEKYR